MPEKNDKSDDVVSKEDYNKVVESANSAKSELEKKEKELKDLKEEGEKKEEVAEKKVWEKEKEELQKQNEELQKKVEQKPKSKKAVAKGIVQDKKDEDKETISADETKKKIDELIPDMDKDPTKFASNIARYGWNKSGTTKKYNDEQLGMALSLQAGAQRADPNSVPSEARKQNNDIIV